jgi:phosphotransferase system enzyme I (PtsP)
MGVPADGKRRFHERIPKGQRRLDVRHRRAGRLVDFEAGLDAFLAKAVSTVAWHMRAAVCSIYLYESETQELVLRANQGLNQEMVGRVRLKIGEGIAGMTLKDMRPICEAKATDNPHYKHVPAAARSASCRSSPCRSCGK